MADGVDIDLYSDEIDQNFGQMKDEYVGDEDLYDDVVVAPSSEPHERVDNENGPIPSAERPDGIDSNGSYSHLGNNFPPNHIGRRHQLYVGNLTWWTTDQDIADAVNSVGVADFQEVKFFENRANGQSKGFCVISLATEASMRLCLERLPKNELHGQKPMVTLPTKQALNQFESQQKTRPIPPQTNTPRGQAPIISGGPMQGNNYTGGPGSQPGGHPPHMMILNGPPGGGGFRPQHMPPQNMQGPMGPNQCAPHMQQPMMHHVGRPMGPQQPQGPPRFQNQNQWNCPPRQNGPIRPGMPNGPPGPTQHRPIFQGQPSGMPPRGPRSDWNRPNLMHQGFQQAPNGPSGHNQSNQMMSGPPRGPPPQQMGNPGNMHSGVQQMPAPHVNPAFFNQNSGPAQHHPLHHPNSGGMGQPHNMQPQAPSHFPPMDNIPRSNNAWPPGPVVKPQPIPPVVQFPEQVIQPQLSEVEFEEIMSRNRTVSSSAIARAVSDAAAAEYSSAIETLVTAISLIKQSKVAHDERCKILVSALQDTLHGIESKSYSRRERSRSRDRSHRDRRPRRDRSRERSSSRYRDRSRERRERDGNSRYYAESGNSYRDSTREARERSRSRDRTGTSNTGAGGTSSNDHYREESSNSRSARPRNKSPDVAGELTSETSKRSNYYDERYNRSTDRDRDRDRDREREHRSRH